MIYYSRLLNDVLSTETLKLEDFGLLWLMAAQGASFRFHRRWLAQQCHCGEAKVQGSLNRLREAGLVSVEILRVDGKIIDKYIKLNRIKVIK
jgi:hypothetical protein